MNYTASEIEAYLKEFTESFKEHPLFENEINKINELLNIMNGSTIATLALISGLIITTIAIYFILDNKIQKQRSNLIKIKENLYTEEEKAEQIKKLMGKS